MATASERIQERLFALQDPGYRDFQSKLMPTVDKERVIGVRTPDLRRLAKDLSGTDEAAEFMSNLPHQYYEENNLHAFLVEGIRDYDTCMEELNRFLPYVDNWATCDSMAPKVFRKNLPELLTEIRKWLASDQTYTVRYGIGMLMRYYLDDAFSPEYPKMIAEIVSEEYYIKMMVAWYFATALAKQYDRILPYIEENRLEPWTHNKTIQKAIESYRITPEQKAYLREKKR